MSEDDIVHLYNFFFRIWRLMPKNEIRKIGHGSSFWLSFEVDDRQMLLHYFKGPRGGVKELVVIMRMTASIEVEKLQHAHMSDALYESNWSLQRNIRTTMRERGLSFQEATTVWLESLLKRIKSGDPRIPYESMREVGEIRSIRTIASGLPSLGRRHR